MKKLLAFLKTEPVLVISGLVSAVIDLAVSFGFHLSAKQVGAVQAVVVAVLAVISRSQVTPTP